MLVLHRNRNDRIGSWSRLPQRNITGRSSSNSRHYGVDGECAGRSREVRCRFTGCPVGPPFAPKIYLSLLRSSAEGISLALRKRGYP